MAESHNSVNHACRLPPIYNVAPGTIMYSPYNNEEPGDDANMQHMHEQTEA